jgi:Carboxypeptidase regulatory-like domain
MNSDLFGSQAASPSRLALTALFGMTLILTIIPDAFGQVDRAVLEGTVTDPSGSVIAGAKLKVVAIDTRLSEKRQTNSRGYYRFPGLVVGRYTETVSSEGFKTNGMADVLLLVGQTRTLDVQLAVGAATERVDVTAFEGPAERSSAEQSIRIGSKTSAGAAAAIYVAPQVLITSGSD